MAWPPYQRVSQLPDAVRRRKRARARLRLARQIMGGHCAECGLRTSLHFHHLEPSEKSGTVSTMAWHAAELTFWREVAKCVLLCRFHHADRHRSHTPEPAYNEAY